MAAVAGLFCRRIMNWLKRTVSFIFTDEAAANGDVKYFREKYRRAVVEENWQDRAV